MAYIKTQSAMEYLMTYGWAILIIAVVLVALFQMGVFNSANFAPKAQPGSCQVFRTTAATSLEGTCNNELPQYVAQFNGANSFINSQEAIPVNTAEFGYTISAWVYQNPDLADNIFDQVVGIGTTNVDLSISTNNANGDTIGAWACGYQGATVTVKSILHSWHYISVVYPQNTLGWTPAEIYLDGQYIGTSAIGRVSPCTATYAFQMADTYGGYATWFNGSISNVQIYNTSLSSNDIASLYQEGIGGAPQNTQNLVGWWPLNGNANDYSGNLNNGAATNVIYSSNWENEYTAP